MNSFYSIVYAGINPASGDKLAVGLFLLGADRPRFAWSKLRLSLVRDLMGGDAHRLLAQNLKALQRKADYADALYNRGNVYRDMRNIEAAMKDYAAALKIRYNYSQVYNNRGIIYGGRGRRELALEDFNKAIDYDPDYSSAYFNRSLVYMQTGDYERALADVRKARELGKDVHEVYIQQIQSLIKQRGKATDHE